MNKSRANFHPTTSCLGMRNPPQKIDRKFGRLDLFMRCIWNQKTSYTCINVTHSNMFKYIQTCPHHHKISPTSTKPSNCKLVWIYPCWCFQWCFQWVYPNHSTNPTKLRSSEGSKTLGRWLRPQITPKNRRPGHHHDTQLKVLYPWKLTWLAGMSQILIGDTSTQMVGIFRCHSLVFWRLTTGPGQVEILCSMESRRLEDHLQLYNFNVADHMANHMRYYTRV